VSKSVRLVVFSILAASFLSVPTRAQTGVNIEVQNPLQIATLHWYSANLSTSFTVGNLPHHVAFDGASIWVTNFLDNTVTKLRASDGTVLGTFAAATPTGVAFDGANVWVANVNVNTVTKLRGSDGTLLGSSAWA
jgi:hypothetical protein